jgi:hypothetical protein
MRTARHSAARSRRGALPARIGFALASVFLVTPFFSLEAAARTAEAVQLEAEDYVASMNVGGSPIQMVGCSAARGGLAVDGVDYAGDYIEWSLSLAQEFVFRDSLRSAGAVGLVRRYAVLFLPAGGGPPVASDTLTTTPGLGIT